MTALSFCSGMETWREFASSSICFLLRWTWPKGLQAWPPHKGTEGCQLLERFFVLKWVPDKRPGSVPCFRVCKMTPRKCQSWSLQVFRTGCLWSLAQNPLHCAESRTEIITFLCPDLSKCINVSPKQICGEIESYGQRNCAPRSP